jgi:hypothetical protein
MDISTFKKSFILMGMSFDNEETCKARSTNPDPNSA